MSNFLYENPKLYERIFRSASKECTEVFQKYLPNTSSSVLDIGCGTGRELSQLSELYECVGFDILPNMVDFARNRNPDLTILQGDMRSFRLDRTFDAIYSVGDTINYAVSNDELSNTIKTYEAHSHKDTLLFLELLNPSNFFGKFQVPSVFAVPFKGSIAIGQASYKLLKHEQIVERTRTWEIEGKNEKVVESPIQFRVIFPAELTYFLNQRGFEVIEIFEKQRNAIYVKSMYVVARYTG